MIVHTKCKLNNAELFLELVCIFRSFRAKKFKSEKYHKQNKDYLKTGKGIAPSPLCYAISVLYM